MNFRAGSFFVYLSFTADKVWAAQDGATRRCCLASDSLGELGPGDLVVVRS
jgi:hypothetical protein